MIRLSIFNGIHHSMLDIMADESLRLNDFRRQANRVLNHL